MEKEKKPDRINKLRKYTIELEAEDLVLINVVKSIMNLKSIGKALSFILKDYAKKNKYSKFINQF